MQAKTLDGFVRDRTFLARRHAALLDGPLVDDPRLRLLQQHFQNTAEPIMRRHFALCFQWAVRGDRTRLAALLEERLLPADLRQLLPPDVALSINPGNVEQMLEELDAIVNGPPVTVSPEKNRQASERFSRAVYARELYDAGLSVAEISRRLCASLYFGNASPATVRRYLDELGVARRRRGKRT